MADLILHKYSATTGVTPASGELQTRELAINTADGKLFTKKTDGTVVEIGGGSGGGSGTVTSITAGTGLTGGTITTSGTIAADFGTTSGKICEGNDARLAFRPSIPSSKPPTGYYVSAMIVSDTYSSLALVANRIYWIPFIPQRDLSVDAVAIGVVTAVAGGLVRCGIYASDGDGNPTGAPLVETVDFDASTTGTKVDTTATVSLTAGTMYWLATIGSTTAAIRAIPRTALTHLFSDPATNVGMVGWYRNGWTYATPLPTLPISIFPYNTTSPTPFLRIT